MMNTMRWLICIIILGGSGMNGLAVATGMPPVSVRTGNLVSKEMSCCAGLKSFGWRFSSEEAWECVLDEPGDFSTAEYSVRAGLKSKTHAAWYSATLPLPGTVVVPGEFRFGGWIRIDDGIDYYRDHLAAIQLISKNGFSTRLRSYCQNGKWIYFEGRTHIPAAAGALSLQLVARCRSYKDALVSFKGVFLIPDGAVPPAWGQVESPGNPENPWRGADRRFRLTGEVADSSGGQPLWVDFDFSRLLLKAGCREPIDPSSIQVMAVFPEGKEQAVPAAYDHSRGNLEDCYLRNGTLKWRTVEGAHRYEIYFNTAGPEGPKPRTLAAPLGIGELLRYPAGQHSLLWGGWPGQDLDVKDVDGDGDLDIYAQNTDAGIWLLRNIGSTQNPLFLPRQKPLQRDALPVMPLKDLRIDWNRDGAMDSIVYKRIPLGAGRYIDGVSVSLHARMAGTGTALADVVDQDGEPVVFGNATWFSMRSGDFDGDGAPDIVAGSADSDLQVLLNRGVKNGKPVVERTVVPWNLYGDPNDSGDMSLKPCPVDWNGDGRDDIVWTGWSGTLHLLINKNLEGRAAFKDAGSFREVSGIVNVIESPTPEAADWDGDGDPDLICGNVNGYFMWLENTGTATQPKLASAKPLADERGNEFRVTAAEVGATIQGPCEQWWGYTSCAAADVDQDGDLDLIINDSLGRLRWIENVGTRTKPRLSPDIRTFLYKGKPVLTPWRNKPAVADWNADGVEEVTVLDNRGQLVAYPFNQSDPDRLGNPVRFCDQEGRGVAVNAELITRPNSGRTQLDAADWDGDGDIDLMAGRPRNANEGNLLYFENIGTPQEPVLVRGSMKARGARFAQWSSGDGHDQWHSTGPCMVDWNGNGEKDLIFGVEMGQLAFYTHDYFEGDAFPVFHADVFQCLEKAQPRTVFDFNAPAGEFTESLKPLDYPPQLLQEDAVISKEPRIVKIISPKAGDVLSGPVVFEATASGGRTITRVDFFVDGQFLAKERMAPFVAFGDDNTWNLQGMSDGPHELSVEVTYFDGRVISCSQTNRVENQ